MKNALINQPFMKDEIKKLGKNMIPYNKILMAACTFVSFNQAMSAEINLDNRNPLRPQELARCLVGWREDRNLMTLSLNNNGITEENQENIANFLRNNPTLRTLNLGGNHINNVSALLFETVLTNENTVLTNFNLANYDWQEDEDYGVYNVIDQAILDRIEIRLEINRNRRPPA